MDQIGLGEIGGPKTFLYLSSLRGNIPIWFKYNIEYSPESPGQVPYGLASLPTQITDLLLNNCGKAKEISEAYVELE